MFPFKRTGREFHLPPQLKVLRQVDLFSGLSVRELKALESVLHERTYVRDEIVFDEGDEGLGMYIVMKGSVRIVKKIEGRQEEIVMLKSGDFFGELALLDGYPRTAAAMAAEPCILLGIFRPEFLALLQGSDRLGVKLALKLAQVTVSRMRQTLSNRVPCKAL